MTDFTKCRLKVLQNAPREHSAILLTFIKLPFAVKTFVLSIFEWPPKTGFAVNLTSYKQNFNVLAGLCSFSGLSESHLVRNSENSFYAAHL